VKAAAAIIREDIQSALFDDSHYPAPGRMCEDINSQIPVTDLFFGGSYFDKRRFNLQHLKLVCTNISHSIMTNICAYLIHEIASIGALLQIMLYIV